MVATILLELCYNCVNGFNQRQIKLVVHIYFPSTRVVLLVIIKLLSAIENFETYQDHA